MIDSQAPCPCGSGHLHGLCCGALLAGTPAVSAEALMRSRYTAFVVGDFAYLDRTHAPEAREGFNHDATAAAAKDVIWHGLTIRRAEGGGPNDQTGTVEFLAHLTRQGVRQKHHELARFRRENGQWVYVDGEIDPKGPPVTANKVGRNDPCPCGSGKKYKKCCGG